MQQETPATRWTSRGNADDGRAGIENTSDWEARMHPRTILIIIVAAAILALAAVFLIPLFTPSVPPPLVRTPDYWPTDEWRTSTPEEQGFDSASLAEHLLKLHEDGVALD